jgi:small multidrug resistance pump
MNQLQNLVVVCVVIIGDVINLFNLLNKMISPALAGIIIAMSLIELFAQIFIKTYYDTKKVYWFFLALMFYSVILYLLYRAYFFTGLAVANGLWSALTLLLTTVVGIFYYKESLGMAELSGILLTTVGILILGFYSNEKAEEL